MNPLPRLLVRGRALDLSRPLTVGVVGVSDTAGNGGSAVAEAALELVEAGAAMVDVEAVESVEALRRIIEVARRASPEVLASVSTRDPTAVRDALDAGVDMVNYLAGFDAEVAALCARADAILVVQPDGLNQVEAQGVSREATVVDAGLGMAETFEQLARALQQLDHIRSTGRPLLLDLAGKAALGSIAGPTAIEQLAGMLATIGHVVHRHPACLLRVRGTDTTAAVTDYLSVAAVLSGQRTIPENLMLAPHLRRQPPPAAS